jgi:hypothetical protein
MLFMENIVTETFGKSKIGGEYFEIFLRADKPSCPGYYPE